MRTSHGSRAVPSRLQARPEGRAGGADRLRPSRAEAWPTIDTAHFEVHELGDTWAEVTEGTAAAWERARYEWEPAGDTVTITTLDSKLFGAGGGWVFRMTPRTTAPASTSS